VGQVAGKRGSSRSGKKSLPKLGTGKRFAAVAASAAKSGARNPAGVAAAAGRKKYGKAAFQAMAKAGRKRAAAKHKAR
jgi:hypothetical protein